jgi:2-C-methyl-D-erythritol 2,4-cyclodiphosphate synthase
MKSEGGGRGTTVTTGLGYDCHRFADGRRLVLGGVELAHDRGLAGHSDADVLTHAVIDALLGAAALGDIGEHFPDTDERYRDADSLIRFSLARAIGISPEHVSVKATRGEGMGFVGRGEGAAALAVATVER